MNERYLHTFQYGMSAQLKEITLDEMVLYVRNHLHSFLLDENVCFCFIDRLANDPATAGHDTARAALLYLLDKALQLRPFRLGLLEAVARLTGNPQVRQRMELVTGHMREKETYDLITGLDLKTDAEEAGEFLATLIRACPDHVPAAQYALKVARRLGVSAEPWLEHFVCPEPLRRDWAVALFNHHAALCDFDKAMTLWPTLNQPALRETSLNLAAAMFAAQGDTQQAIRLYESSLRQDPRQTPVRLRLAQYQSPFVADSSLLTRCRVNICLYSWNKADMLGQTLEGLSRSDIGPARIDVLLNGCTDHSREVVERARALFPHNEFTVHDLHVNIGAPAARNWLTNLPEVRASDYIAFLDDDVTVQKDWLAAFLTVAEADPRIGVVGCKVLHPGQPAMFQYLYRHVAIADHGLLKMSLHAPENQFDTGIYDVVRETRNVMGCLHLLRTSALAGIPAGFDIRFSPSQVDDIDHDIALCLGGHRIMYCGPVACIHHQSSGVNATKVQWRPSSVGSVMGNDIKFFFKHYDHLPRLKALDCLSLDLGVPLPDF